MLKTDYINLCCKKSRKWLLLVSFDLEEYTGDFWGSDHDSFIDLNSGHTGVLLLRKVIELYMYDLCIIFSVILP